MTDKEAYNKGKDVAKTISNVSNSTLITEWLEFIKGMSDVFTHNHRTLQYDEVMLLIRLLNDLSYVGTDGRNEQAIELAKIAKQAIEKKIGFDIKYI